MKQTLIETLKAKIDLYYALNCPAWMKPEVTEARDRLYSLIMQ